MEVSLYFDGASRGNPGDAGAGAYIKAEDSTMEFCLRKPLGKMTNNQAEYEALILGLNQILTLKQEGMDINYVKIMGDSQLIIKQMMGQWQVKSENLKDRYHKAGRLLEIFAEKNIIYDLSFIPRNENKMADELANKGADDN